MSPCRWRQHMEVQRGRVQEEENSQTAKAGTTVQQSRDEVVEAGQEESKGVSVV